MEVAILLSNDFYSSSKQTNLLSPPVTISMSLQEPLPKGALCNPTGWPQTSHIL